MTRGLRILFVVLLGINVGFSANCLYAVYSSGRLVDPYSKEGESAILWLIFSFAAFFWFLGRGAYRPRSQGRYPRGGQHQHDSYGYGSSANSQPSKRAGMKEKPGIGFQFPWVGLLQACVGIASLAYILLFVYTLFFRHAIGLGVLFGCMSVYSLLLIIGLIRRGKRVWGWGFVFSVLHLFWFPFGTAYGTAVLLILIQAAAMHLSSCRPVRSEGNVRGMKPENRKERIFIIAPLGNQRIEKTTETRGVQPPKRGFRSGKNATRTVGDESRSKFAF